MGESRADISTLIDLSRLSNPCALNTPVDSSTRDCGNSAVLPYARLANSALASLQTKLGECSGMNLIPPIKMPVISADMTREAKMKEIYKSLVHHAGYVQYMTAIRKREGSSVFSEYQSCVAALQNLQCSLSCTADMPSADLAALVAEVGSIKVSTPEDSSSRQLFDCLVVNSTMTLLKTITEQVEP